MEVVFKHTEGKPPFIGVLFESEKAALINLEFIHHFKNIELTLKVSVPDALFNIDLMSDNTDLYYYTGLKYDRGQYDIWRRYSHHKMNFGHCYIKDGKLNVARTESGTLYVFKIGRFLQG